LIISIDPGKNIGVATFTNSGKDISKTVMSEGSFFRFLELIVEKVRGEKNTFIVEKFSLRQDLALEQTGSTMPASEIIGAVKFIDYFLKDKVELVWSSPGNIKSALKVSGMHKYLRHSHPPDDIVAYAHGVQYLINKEIRKHPIFEMD
jgi:hypothetical protein